MGNQLIEKIMQKKEYSQLPLKDVEMAFGKFDKEKYLDEEKIKLTRKLLREVFSSFTSQKLLSLRDKDAEWILRKHFSTRERLPYYEEIYKRIFKNLKNVNVIDLGAGINGFSYPYFGGKVGKYVAVESMGQLVESMNFYFEKEKINGEANHLSLFELEKVKELIKKCNSAPFPTGMTSEAGGLGVLQNTECRGKIVFLFKTIDSLEMLKKDYSKKLISEIVGLVDKVVVSFATKSMGSRTRFRANRKWIVDFIKDNFSLLDDFELGGERYLVFSKS